MTPASAGGTVFLSEIQLCWWVWRCWKTASCCPFLPRRGIVAIVVQEALTVKQTISLPISRLSSDPNPQLLCAWIMYSPSSTVVCFISGWCMEFKTANLKRPLKVWTFSPPPEERLTLHPAPFCPRKEVVGCMYYGWNLWWSTEKNFNQVICLLHTPLSPAVKQLLNGAQQDIFLWRGNILSFKLLQEGEHSLPM